jgi:NlpC/P60 family
MGLKMGCLPGVSPSRVAVRCGILGLIFLTACAVDKPVGTLSERSDRPQSKPFQMTANPLRNRVMLVAKAQLGKSYRRGGISPGNGFDCSGLVYFTHRQAGLNVPRTSHSQLDAVKKVPLDQIEPGDLLFFQLASTVSHVGIYIGGDEFIHAPSEGKKVSRSSLSNRFWLSRFIVAGNFYN